MLSAGSKVNQLDCNLAALGHLALSHQNILWLQVPMTPVLMQLSQDLHGTVCACEQHTAKQPPTLCWMFAFMQTEAADASCDHACWLETCHIRSCVFCGHATLQQQAVCNSVWPHALTARTPTRLNKPELQPTSARPCATCAVKCHSHSLKAASLAGFFRCLCMCFCTA